jgi:hypothetical protein
VEGSGRRVGDFGFEVDRRTTLESGMLLLGEGDLDFDIQEIEFCQRKETRAKPEKQSIHCE